MKKIYLFNFVFVFILISCQEKQGSNIVKIPSTIPAHINSLDVVISDTNLGDNFDNIDFDKLPRMTMVLYDSLQLSKISDLQGYDTTYLSMGRILLSNENGRIITIQVITGGEISEYLVSYDKGGQLIDSMVVAYEDMVEYYSAVTSIINSNKITVQTVNFTYADEYGNPIELSDTAITRYQITPEFRFIRL